MQLSARLARLLDALGVAAEDLPRELFVEAPFGQRAPELDALAQWLGARCAERADAALPVLAARPFDPLATRVLGEALRALARVDAAAARRHAEAVTGGGVLEDALEDALEGALEGALEDALEDALHLGALARAAALVAAAAGGAEDALDALAPILRGPRPVARAAAIRLGELALAETLAGGPLGARAFELLEDALAAAFEDARDLGASGEVAAMLDRSLAELALPGMKDRAESAEARIIDLAAVLGGLAAHRAGLAGRLAERVREAPAPVAHAYAVSCAAALGAAASEDRGPRGPFLDEVDDQLARAASARDPLVRAAAVEALGGAAKRAPALAARIVAALDDPDESVRASAARAAAELGPLSDDAARALERMIARDGSEGVLTATRALARCGRPAEALLTQLDEPVVQAASRVWALLAARTGKGDAVDLDAVDLGAADLDAADAAFAELLEAHAYAGAADPDDDDGDARSQSAELLVEALRAMPAARAAGWMRRFAAGDPDRAAAVDALGGVLYQALDEIDPIPRELVEAGAPLLEVLESGAGERLETAALVAAQLWRDDPQIEARVEARIVERVPSPASLVALLALSRLGAETSEHLLAIAESPGDPHAELALTALRSGDLAAIARRGALPALIAHLADDDPLAASAHTALVGLVERAEDPDA